MSYHNSRRSSKFSLPSHNHHHVDIIIDEAKKDGGNSERDPKETIQALTAALEHLLAQQDGENIHEDQNQLTVKSFAQFNSMIYADSEHDEKEVKFEEVAPEEMAPIHDPKWLKSIPSWMMIINALIFLFGGAFIIQLLDEKIALMPYYKAVLFALQIICTIGWGSPYVMSNTNSKLFCIVFTMFGVPIVFAAFSNIGREVTELYCSEWPILKWLQAILKNDSSNKSDDRLTRLPLKVGFFFLILHQIWGIVLFNYWMHNFGIIESIYFGIISISTTGLGDFKPNPQNMLETLCVMAYLTLGITIISAIYASMAYYWQRWHFITLKTLMIKLGRRIWHKRKPINKIYPSAQENHYE